MLVMRIAAFGFLTEESSFPHFPMCPCSWCGARDFWTTASPRRAGSPQYPKQGFSPLRGGYEGYVLYGHSAPKCSKLSIDRLGRDSTNPSQQSSKQCMPKWWCYKGCRLPALIPNSFSTCNTALRNQVVRCPKWNLQTDPGVDDACCLPLLVVA